MMGVDANPLSHMAGWKSWMIFSAAARRAVRVVRLVYNTVLNFHCSTGTPTPASKKKRYSSSLKHTYNYFIITHHLCWVPVAL